jgi:peptidoglycan/LPS O-acetylase OafA/YrhL
MTRIPTLDGWRGIAILLVLFDHVQAALISGYAHPWMQTGQHGVTVFFVLSGFLITSKLLESPIDLKRFYIRRFFRLMPAAWAYLAAVWLLSLLGGKTWLSLQEIASCIFFFRNFMSSGQLTIFAGHFWSLSMEEQFYIVWPSLLLLAGFRRTRNLAIAGTIAIALFRFFNWGHYDCIWLSFQTQVRADALLIGCLLAMAFSNPALRTAAVRWTKFSVFPALAVMCYCISAFHWLPPLIESLAIAALIAASTLHPHSILARPLSLRPLAWLGTVSYSIYVWQQFFFATRSPSVTIFMMCIMPIFAIASYYLIERPCTRLGHRLTSPRPRTVQTTHAPVAAFAQP